MRRSSELAGTWAHRERNLGRHREMSLRVAEFSTVTQNRFREVFGCAFIGGIGILVLDALTVRYATYYSDDITVLYPVAVHSIAESLKFNTRPLQYIILLTANNIYLPLWLGASLLCGVGATILAALACERLFGGQLARAGWWLLGLANPLLFYLVSQPDTVSQGLCNLLFAGTMLAFASEWHRIHAQPPSPRRADRGAAFLNLMAAALFFTKETAVAAAIVLPAATALIRLKARRLSPLFLISLLLPVGAAIGWILSKLRFPEMLPTAEGHYSIKLDLITWVQNFVVTLAFPVTPLPSSFIAFELLRTLWVAVALVSVALFLGIVLRAARIKQKMVIPLLVILACCTPVILIKPSELYSTMIAPVSVSLVLLFGFSRAPRFSLIYGLLLYGASLANGIIYFQGPDVKLLGLRHLPYAIYDRYYQRDPICSIGATAHIAWDETAFGEYHSALYLPNVRGQPVCVP
jgi:hypothetical protein